MEIKKRILAFLFAGQRKSFFDNHKQEIHTRNSRMVGVLSAVITTALFSFFLISFFFDFSFASHKHFFYCFIYFLTLHITYEQYIRKYIVATNVYLNILLWSLFFSLLFLNYKNSGASVYIPVFFVLLFTLIISAPVYTIASGSFAFVFYLIFVLKIKCTPLVVADIINMVVSFFIGMAIGYVVLVERIHAIQSKETISKMGGREKILTMSGILEDFESVSYADLSGCDFITYRSTEILERNIPGWTEILDFAQRMKLFANEIVVPDDRVHFVESTTPRNIIHHLEREISYSVDFRVLLDKETLYYKTKFIKDPDNIYGVIFGIQDIDSETRLEMDRLEQKVIALQKEKELEQAEAANKAKSQFLSRMTHDIRTPINGVMGMTEIAKNNINNPEKIEDCLEKITVVSEHLLKLVNDILDINRIENGNIELTEEPLKIDDFVESCCTIVEGQIKEKKIEFIKDFDYGNHINVLCDELHLRQVFINILGNSLKYTPNGGKITFKVKEAAFNDKKVTYTFEFSDTGIGIPEDFIPHIWDSFSQVNINTGDSTGSGLGMAIAKSLVDKMGGTISVKSKLGEGTSFIVRIAFKLGTSAAEKETVLSDTSLNGVKLLLVEDNQLNTEIAQELLEEEGAQVICAENGVKALEIFSNSKIGEFDGILMDIIMPVMDGLEATKQIRALEREDSKLIPIVAMTANAFESDEQKSMEAGMNAHLTKPLHIKELKDTLHKLVNKNK